MDIISLEVSIKDIKEKIVNVGRRSIHVYDIDRDITLELLDTEIDEEEERLIIRVRRIR